MFKKNLAIAVSISATIFCLPSSALANHLQSTGRYYGIARNSQTNLEGGLFKATINTISSGWTSGTPYRFINHEIWLHKGVNSNWVELGFTDGYGQDFFSGSSGYHYGHFSAEGDTDSNGNLTYYVENRISGPSTARNSTHQWHMQREGVNKDTWALYINGIKKDAYYAPGPGRDMDVGLETNTISSSSQQWNERSFQYNQAGAWRFWGSGTLNVTPGAAISTTWDSYPNSILTRKLIP